MLCPLTSFPGDATGYIKNTTSSYRHATASCRFHTENRF